MPHNLSIDDRSRNNSRVGLSPSNITSETSSIQNQPVGCDSSGDEHEPHSKWPKEWRAYACWLTCFFLMFNSWGLVNAYGTFSSYYVGHSLKSVDQLELNLIGSTQSLFVLLFSAPVGRLLDAGHFRPVLGTGAFLVPFGMFMLSVAHPDNADANGNFGAIWATQGLVVGLGMACFFVSSSQIAATWFPEHRALAVGVVACGASIAGVVYPTMLRYLIDALGFNDAVRCVAGLVTLTSIYSFIFATPNPAKEKRSPKSYLALATWVDPEALRSKSFCWFTAAIAFLFFGFYPVFFNLEEWAAVSGFGTRAGSTTPIQPKTTTSNPLQTFWLLTLMNGASTLGRLTMSAFGDATGPLNMHIVATALSSLLILILWTLSTSLAHALAFCVIFGMASGAVIGLPPAAISNILRNTYTSFDTIEYKTSKLGQWTGMMYTFAAIPSFVGPIIAGHLVSKYNTYLAVQMWSGVNLALAAICMFVARLYLPEMPANYAEVERAAAREAKRNKGMGLGESTVAMAHSATRDTQATRDEGEKERSEDEEKGFGRGVLEPGNAV